jgi:hypothetical protein
MNSSAWYELLVNDVKNIKRWKKEGARDFFDYIKKLQPKDLVINTTNNETGYFVMRKDLNNYLKGIERWGSPKNTIKKHELNKKLRVFSE